MRHSLRTTMPSNNEKFETTEHHSKGTADKENSISNKNAAPSSTTSRRPKTPPRGDSKRLETTPPLNSHRDPRRTPLLSRMPFTPTPNPKSTGGGAASSTRKKKDVTPAYAYKNAETGLLEIRTVVPPSLSIVANEDDTVVGLDPDKKQCQTRLALYPIALNGGGAGLYRDPREFASVNWGGFSRNHRTEGSRRAPLKSHVRFAWPYEKRNNEAVGREVKDVGIDLEVGLGHALSMDDDHGCNNRPRQSLGSLASAVNPWKVWENIHNEMSRLAAIRTRRAEDEASHVTLARQKNKAARVSSIYNDDDFDFALVLAPHDAYAFWACHLDFREEALHFVDDHGLDLEVDGEEHEDDSTIATATCQRASKQEISRNIIPTTPKTPLDGSGLRRRKKATPSWEKHISSTKSANLNRISAAKAASPGIRHPSHPSPYHIRTAERLGNRVFQQRKSLFERALDKLSPTRPGEDGNFNRIPSQRNITKYDEKMLSSDKDNHDIPTSSNATNRSTTLSPYVPRRRWGNVYDNNKQSSPNLFSPPIVSLKKGSSTKNRVRSNTFPWKVPGSGSRYGKLADDVEKKAECDGNRSADKTSNKRSRENEDFDATNNDNDGEDLFFASPGIPRGIGKLLESPSV